MDNIMKKPLFRFAIQSLIFAVSMIVIGLLTAYFTTYKFIDILFVEGMILVIIGGLSLAGGFPAGLSLKGIGRKDVNYADYIKPSPSVTEKTSEKKVFRLEQKTALVMLSLVTGGVICIILDIVLLLAIYY